jgi:peroxiredoxin
VGRAPEPVDPLLGLKIILTPFSSVVRKRPPAKAVVRLVRDRQETEDTSLVRVGDPVPPFEVKTTDGQVIRSADLHGRVVLLNFFTTSCGPCMQEMPRIQADIWERFRSEGLVVIAVAVGSDDTTEKIRSFAGKHGCTFTFANAKRDVYDRFATRGVPRCYVISPEGRICFMSLGYGEHSKAEFRRLVRLVQAELERTPTPSNTAASS